MKKNIIKKKHTARRKLTKYKQKQQSTKTKTILNTNALTNQAIILPAKNNNICAPFIKPLDLSSNTGLTKANMNIIKSATDESCFTIESLRKIAEKWNTSHPEMTIDFDNTTTGKSLWKSINSVMSAKCNNEICWVKQPFIKDTPLAKELLKNFKPIMPKKWESNPYEWLNTLDIQEVMKQYETKHTDFEFIGPVPMDFDTKLGFGQCVVNELCKIDLKTQLEKGKKKIGVIFNLDKHNQPGSHWVAMYFCYDSGQCCYWDSYAVKPNPEVVTLMNRLKDQSHGMGKTITLKINDVRHQYKNSECGVYCIYFLTSLLAGHTFENIIKNIVSDDKMNYKRKEFFAKI
jgi:hypothetical protein